MKELNIGPNLIKNRRRRGITQEALAEYMGVSKASVSKWETGATYPDITLLPQLATFFHISIDELIGYEPQMTKEDIRRLYRQICHDFFKKPFAEVMGHCRGIVKKYFSCAPLLFQIGSLYVNHCMLAGSPEASSNTLEEAMELFIRTREETDDVALQTLAMNMQALCLLQLGRSDEVLSLLSARPVLMMSPEPLLASAFQMQGNLTEARRTLQAGIYQTLITLLNLLSSYMALCGEDTVSFEESRRRILAIAEAFSLKDLHPGTLLSVYLVLAQEFAKRGDESQTLAALERYTELVSADIYPMKLHGDSYFDLLDEWLENTLALGSDLPRDESVVRKSMIDSIANNPAFAPFASHTQFQDILRRLKSSLR
ncbi:MAG: helix-turn-helix domain-containing protein [Lachnospiraceae bacterium]